MTETTAPAPRDVPFVVGSYASEPTDPVERDLYLGLLRDADWVSGLEIPYPGVLAADPQRVASSLSDRWRSHVITAIPGTMTRVSADPTFGLASPDPSGRARAMEFTRQLCRTVQDLTDAKGHRIVTAVELHSAPTRRADPTALRDSLDELLTWDWAGAEVVLEHCDRWTDARPVEKGFLALGTEIEVARSTGVRVTINWGRACLDERSSAAALAAVEEAHSAGVLAGLMFSGISPAATTYGGAWADAHLPAADDDSDSLMTSADITACTREALRPLDAVMPLSYLGAKISAPADASPARRRQLLETIARAAGVLAPAGHAR